MYPTISHLINDLFGLNIPLPIQTFGLWVAMAFLAAAWIISIELKRKESEGLLLTVKKKEIIGRNLYIYEIISSLLIGFLLGFKGFEALFYYSDLVANPQYFMLSSRGNILGGIVAAFISMYLKWKELSLIHI